MMALLFALYPSSELICIFKNHEDLKAIKQTLGDRFLPYQTILVKEERNEEHISKLMPYLKEYGLQNDQTTYYICKNNTCSAPINTLQELKNAIPY